MSSSEVPFEPDQAEVRAAGGVIWRQAAAGTIEVLVVHRPYRADWSLPKGKVDPGETLEQTAVREAQEETGFDVALGRPLGTVSYFDHKQRSKCVWYWVMDVVGGAETLNNEVDEMVWLDVAAASAKVDYELDREVLRRFQDAIAGG